MMWVIRITCKVCTLIGQRTLNFSRLGDRDKNDMGCHNSSVLEHLPFTKDSFEKTVETMPLHRDIARTVNRSAVAFSLMSIFLILLLMPSVSNGPVSR
jgi:hypothetical protein